MTTTRISLHEAWTGHADCMRCELRKSVLFANLERADFDSIHEPISQITLAPGEVLYRSGDAGKRLFTIRSGLVKLIRYLPDGTQRIVRLVRSTDVIGLEVLLDKCYGHTAQVMQTTELCLLPAQTVTDLSQRNPQLHRELLNRWQRALDEADASLAELSTGPSRHRVARLLLRISEQSDDGRLECSLFAREDIGAILGITTETASRSIAEFKRQGWLAELRSNRYLVDSEALSASLV